MEKIVVFWHRRDLRIEDNAGLYAALNSGWPVLPLFIFDREILDELTDKDDARVSFIHQEIHRLKQELEAEWGSTLIVKYGFPTTVWKELLETYAIAAVYTNHDYEPYALKRDQDISEMLKKKGIDFRTFKDHVIFEKTEVAKANGDPYTVFTPYSKRWKTKLKELQADTPDAQALPTYPTKSLGEAFYRTNPGHVPDLATMGFEPTNISFPSKVVAQGIIRSYDQTRNFPAIEGTSRLGIHFRFGTISIREKVQKAQKLNETYLNELIWRDFYAMILANFPYVAHRSFRSKYESIEWRNEPSEFEAWCSGTTGYPIVDAGMRELNATGYMHNRVRMITASFLSKHLLIDWRWGEAYFARKLLDFDLASNNGGWQWAAGCGTDAAPYFRIFNPYTQQEKFDRQFQYIKKWVPAYQSDTYPSPIVEHKFARERCLRVYKEGLERAASLPAH